MSKSCEASSEEPEAARLPGTMLPSLMPSTSSLVWAAVRLIGLADETDLASVVCGYAAEASLPAWMRAQSTSASGLSVDGMVWVVTLAF